MKFAVHFGEEPSKLLFLGVFTFFFSFFTEKGVATPEVETCFGELKLFGEASTTDDTCEAVRLISLFFLFSTFFFDFDARPNSCFPLISLFRASPLAT